MSKRREHPIWQHVIWPIVSLLAVGSLTYVGVWIFGSWQGFFSKLSDIYVFLTSEITVSRISYWIPLGILLALIGCGLLLLINGKLYKYFPRWRAYNQDYFFKVFWRWSYPICPEKLFSYCPKCDAQLFQKQDNDNKAVLWCPICSSSYGPYGEQGELTYQDIQECVQRYIDRNIRQDDWHQHLGTRPMLDAVPISNSTDNTVESEKSAGKLVQFKCLGSRMDDKLRWLSVENGDVVLVADKITKNTIWLVEELPEGMLAICNYNCSNPKRWLYGRTRMKDGEVLLCDKPQVSSGTGGKWKIHNIAGKERVIRIECKGSNRERIWIDGKTKQGIVELVPENKIENSGTSWEMVVVIKNQKSS